MVAGLTNGMLGNVVLKTLLMLKIAMLWECHTRNSNANELLTCHMCALLTTAP